MCALRFATAMFYQIASFLLDVAAGLLCSACLLRLYMQWQRVPFGNPIGQVVFALTDWLILPLRKVIPPLGRIDGTSLLAAGLVELSQYFLLWLLLGAGSGLLWLPALALFGVVRVALTGITGLIIVYTILSWVQTRSAISDVLAKLAEPLLRPMRRVVPLVGGVDFAPLVLLVLLQVAVMVLGYVQGMVLR